MSASSSGFTPDKKKILRQASPAAVKKNFLKLASYWSTNRWIGKGNRYARNTANRIKGDFDKKNNGWRTKGKPKHVNEFIAASVLTHALDSWSYFGNAVAALLRGNPQIAKHLLYYSELRSAISILASRGIGVFNGPHSIVGAKNKSQPLRASGTHEFTWEALNFWIRELDAPDSIGWLICPAGEPLHRWLEEFHVPESTRRVVLQDFLLDIGIDLKLFSDDREARNEASYAPSAVVDAVMEESAKVDLGECILCWNLCLPSIENGSLKMDELLLKRLLYVAFKGIHPHGRSAKQAKRQFSHKAEMMFDGLGFGRARRDYWRELLTKEHAFESVFDYVSDSRRHSETYIYSMLYRALFLLRIDMAFCGELIQGSGLKKEDLNFWWNYVGYNAGLWGKREEIASFSDLWGDIQIELEHIAELASSSLSPFAFRKSDISAQQLSSFERVYLWSIGS